MLFLLGVSPSREDDEEDDEDEEDDDANEDGRQRICANRANESGGSDADHDVSFVAKTLRNRNRIADRQGEVVGVCKLENGGN